MSDYNIIWTTQAKQDLKAIYTYWHIKTAQGAINLRSELLNSPKTIYFAKQYQLDDIV